MEAIGAGGAFHLFVGGIKADGTYTGVNVYAAIGNTTGTAYVTCFQLEEGTIANRLNLLENGSFDRAGDNDAIPGLKANGTVICENIYDGEGRMAGQKDIAGGAEHTTTYAFADGPRMGTTTSLVERVTSGGKTSSFPTMEVP